MLKTYFKIALRSLRRHRFYTVINVFGLALGIGCCIILFQFITYHLSFDTYHHDAEQVYRIVNELRVGDGSVERTQGNSIALGNNVKTRISQVKEVGIISRIHKLTLAIPQSDNRPDKLFAEDETTALITPGFFNLFDYHWEQGDKRTALNSPNAIVLSHGIAEKYFGSQDVIGKAIIVNKAPFTVTGIVENHPANTDIKTEVFISLSSIKAIYPDQAERWVNDWSWVDSRNNVFVKLTQGTTVPVMNASLKKMDKSNLGPEYTFVVQQLKDVHFDARYGGVVQLSLLVT